MLWGYPFIIIQIPIYIIYTSLLELFFLGAIT